MLREKVDDLLDKILSENNSLFVISSTVSADNIIRVVLDGDKEISLQDCIDVSRALENQLDREQTDFSLEVSSAGATSPLTNPRQYNKHIGRKLSVRTPGEKIEGKLTAASPDNITLEWKSREPKPVGKGKVTVQNKKEIPISEIEEAKVVLKF